MTDPGWQPDQYNRFAAERREPFDELVELCRPIPDGVAYDLGCGTGTLTADLVDRLQAQIVIGVDASEAMLAKAEPLSHSKLSFVAADLETFTPDLPADLILSNAALHWLDDHPSVLATWASHLAPGGQLAVQVPSNLDHPIYELAASVAEEATGWVDGQAPEPAVASVLAPERYAEILHDLGGTNIHVALRVYTHLLDTTGDAIEWIKGAALVRYREALGDEDYASYETELHARAKAEIGQDEPYLFTFKRVLMWARFSDA